MQEERSFLYVPGFPIAAWMVHNWWSLLYEPSRTESLPRSGTSRLSWIRRHCLRTADSSLLLPALYLFNQGSGIQLVWQADQNGSLSHMPGEFVDSGWTSLSIDSVQDVLARFISETLTRVADISDDRVRAVQDQWHTVLAADADEKSFCIAAGRLGLNPYDANLPEDVAQVLEEIQDPDLPIIRDWNEIASPDNMRQQWDWIDEVRNDLEIGKLTDPRNRVKVDKTEHPFRAGYAAARSMRVGMGVPEGEPLPSLPDRLFRETGTKFSFVEKNHVPGKGIKSLVGWHDSEIVVAGPLPTRTDSRRFLEARGLFLALAGCDRTERLATDAHTWDQQASRAFAAELLAPQATLGERIADDPADRTVIEELAQEFEVGNIVIERQLRNSGIELTLD